MHGSSSRGHSGFLEQRIRQRATAKFNPARTTTIRASATRSRTATPPDDGIAVEHACWLVAKLVLIAKKPDLSQAKNWRAVCLLEMSSKTFSNVYVKGLHTVIEATSQEAQADFRLRRGTRDAFFALILGLKKRRERGQDSWPNPGCAFWI